MELPSITLKPQQVADVDLSVLRQAVSSRSDLDTVSVQILNSGAPGSLIGAAYSRERGTQLTYDVPLRDSGKNRNGSGSYPWRIDNDYSTVVAISNIGDQPARFQVELRYPGGPYSIKQRDLGPGETAMFDLRQLRDEQQPDRTGKTLPSTLDRGQFHWSIVATPGDARIIGRAEVVSRSARVASSYSCPVCCPDSGPSGGFSPNDYGLFVSGYDPTGAGGNYYDCYGNFYAGSLAWSSVWTDNTSVATVNSYNAELFGAGTGDTAVAGSYQYVDWFTDGMDCYQSYGSGYDSAPVGVFGQEVHFTTVSLLDPNRTTEFLLNVATLNIRSDTGPSACGGEGFWIRARFDLPQYSASCCSNLLTFVKLDSDNEYSLLDAAFYQNEGGLTGYADIKLRRVDIEGRSNKVNIHIYGYYQNGDPYRGLGIVRLTCP